MSKDDYSGEVRLVNQTIFYSWKSGHWQVPVKSLKVIGEHTNDHGPGADDYFFTFLTGDREYEASFYADGRDWMLRDLGRILGSELKCGLVDSTSFNSRVMWPPDIEGQPLFNFVPKPRKGFLWARFKNWFIPLFEYHLTESVKSKLSTD